MIVFFPEGTTTNNQLVLDSPNYVKDVPSQPFILVGIEYEAHNPCSPVYSIGSKVWSIVKVMGQLRHQVKVMERLEYWTAGEMSEGLVELGKLLKTHKTKVLNANDKAAFEPYYWANQ